MLPSILGGPCCQGGVLGEGTGRAAFVFVICDAEPPTQAELESCRDERAGRGGKRTGERVGWGWLGRVPGKCLHKDGEGDLLRADGRLSLEVGGVCVSMGVSLFRVAQKCVLVT